MKTRKGAVIYAIGMMVTIALDLVSTGSLWAEAMEGAAQTSQSIATVQSAYGNFRSASRPITAKPIPTCSSSRAGEVISCS